MPFRWLRQNKAFGLCIHPVINGYSRRILWLEDRAPNNDSRIVARYLLDCVKQVSGVPRCVLGDRGTENVYICALQHFFLEKMEQTRWLERKALYMRWSVSHHWTDAWWYFLSKNATDWWINQSF